MTVRFHFKSDLSINDLSKAIWPDESGYAFDLSGDSPDISRHDIRVSKTGRQTYVEIDGVSKQNLSQTTVDNIIATVPTDHIQTNNV